MRNTLYLPIMALLCSAPAYAETALAEIAILPTETGVAIEGSVVGLSGGTVEGELTIEKAGPSGQSNIVQKRTVDIKRGTREVIGSTGISMQRGAELSVTVTVRENGRDIATATSVTGMD
ncbi:MAG: curli-like amyloid fiber formation chaperone CsgH [Dinoroseobacter sp.]|nr:curli-like amyloid fiber formation chaperone CsgH [Dinoroseobacter sp.]